MASAWASFGLAAVLASSSSLTRADESASPNSTAARIHGRVYLSPSASYAFTDGGRVTDNGYGGSFAIGKQFNPQLAIELSGQYSRLSPASLYGVGANALFFPGGGSFYALGGAAYGKLRSHPGNNADYAAALINVGAGWLWRPFTLLGNDVFLRTEALYRLDAHSDRRTGNNIGNGRKAFNDAVFNVGFLIPLGTVRTVTDPAPAEAVQVVPVEPVPDVPTEASSAATLDDAPPDAAVTPTPDQP